jgi:hypothetical protein
LPNTPQGKQFFAHRVNLISPYNEHLVTDVGGLYLGFAVLFALAAAASSPPWCAAPPWRGWCQHSCTSLFTRPT